MSDGNPRIVVRVNDQQLDMLDRRAYSTGRTRSEIVRDALIEYLARADHETTDDSAGETRAGM